MVLASDLYTSGSSGVSQLTLQAGENITIGNAIQLGVDGKAYKSAGVIQNGNIRSPLPLATTTRYLMDTTANKIIALGVNTGDTTKLYTCVGTVSATTNGSISWGTVTTHTMTAAIGASTSWWDAVRQTANQLFIVYHVSAGGTIYGRIVEYSGTTTTVGTEATLAATGITTGTLLANLVADSSGRVLLTWFRNTTGLGFGLWGSRITVAGTTITFGAETQINLWNGNPGSGVNQRIEMLYDSTQDRAIIVAQVDNNIDNSIILVNFSSAVTTVQNASLVVGFTTSGSQLAVLSRVSGTSSYAVRIPASNTTTNFRLLTISTTAITLGTAVTLNTNCNSITTSNWAEDTVNNKIIIGYDSSGCGVYTRSGTTLTLEKNDTNLQFNSTSLNFFSPNIIGNFNSLLQVYNFSTTYPRLLGAINNHYASTCLITNHARQLGATSGITYFTEREAGRKLSDTLKVALLIGKPTNENLLGIAIETITSGNNVKIALEQTKTAPAKLVVGLSSLTPGAHYYTTATGTVDIAGQNYLGYAKSATELVLGNYNGAEF